MNKDLYKRMPPTIHPSKHPRILAVGIRFVIIESPEAWSAASGHKVQELMASWTEQMGYFFGDFWFYLGNFGEIWRVGFGLGFGWLVLVAWFCWVGLVLVGFGCFGFIFNWGNGLLVSLFDGWFGWFWFVLVGLFWLICFGWFVQLSKLRYVFSCLW